MAENVCFFNLNWLITTLIIFKAYPKTLAIRNFHKKSPVYLVSTSPKPIQKTDHKPKISQGKVLARSRDRSPDIVIALKPSRALCFDWRETKLVHRCGMNNLPLESFFPRQLCWFVAIARSFSNCLSQDKQAMPSYGH